MGLVDLIFCQVDRREVPNYQVGRGKEMRLSESLTDSIESSYQQGVLMDKDSCGFADHVNEYYEKLNTLTIQEEDQRSILIIGGIRIFLPDSPIEARACVVDATIGEGQASGDCHDEREDIKSFPRRRGRNGANTDVYPSRRRRSKRTAPKKSLGSPPSSSNGV
jgi:hypothetical protein